MSQSSQRRSAGRVPRSKKPKGLRGLWLVGGLFGLVIVVAIVGLLALRSNSPPASSVTAVPATLIPRPSWLTVTGFDPVHEKAIIDAAEEWDAKLHCGFTVQVMPFIALPGAEGGKQAEIQEQSNPGIIRLDPKYPPQETRNIVLHAMTHACEQNDFTSVPSFQIGSGTIIGYRGAVIQLRFDNSEVKYYTYLEEAIAERNARLFSGYSVHYDPYDRIGKLALDHLPDGVDVEQYMRNSDVRKLIATFLHQSTASDEDMGNVLLMLNDAYEGR